MVFVKMTEQQTGLPAADRFIKIWLFGDRKKC